MKRLKNITKELGLLLFQLYFVLINFYQFLFAEKTKSSIGTKQHIEENKTKVLIESL